MGILPLQHTFLGAATASQHVAKRSESVSWHCCTTKYVWVRLSIHAGAPVAAEHAVVVSRAVSMLTATMSDRCRAAAAHMLCATIASQRVAKRTQSVS